MRAGNTVILNATFTITSKGIPSWYFQQPAASDFSSTKPQMLWPLNKANLANPGTAAPNLFPVVMDLLASFASAEATVLSISARALTGFPGLAVKKNATSPVLVYLNGGGIVPAPTSLRC